MTMGAPRKGGGRDTPMSRRTALHGPSILQHLGNGAAPPAPAAKPACPPSLPLIVHDAVHAMGKSGRRPTFAAPSLEAIESDPACRKLEEIVPVAVDRAREGLCAGRLGADLQGEIRNLVMEDVQNLVIGDVFKDVRLDMLDGDHDEEDMYLGVVAASVAEQLAAEVIGDAAAEPSGKGRVAAELVRAALASAEPTLFLIVRIAAALADAAAEYIRGLKAAEKDDPKMVLVDAAAQAVVKAGASFLRGPLPLGGTGGRKQLARMADDICREIVRQLSDPQEKIGGQDEEGEREA